MSFYFSEIVMLSDNHSTTHLNQGRMFENQKKNLIQDNLKEGLTTDEWKSKTDAFHKFKDIVSHLTTPFESTNSKYVKDGSNNWFYASSNNVLKRTNVQDSNSIASYITVSGNLMNPWNNFYKTIDGKNMIRGTDISFNKLNQIPKLPTFFTANEIFTGSNTGVLDDASKCSFFSNYDISKNNITSSYECMNQAILNGRQYAMLKNGICKLSNTDNTTADSTSTNYSTFKPLCDNSSNMDYGYRYNISQIGNPELLGKNGYINGNLEYETAQNVFTGNDKRFGPLLRRKYNSVYDLSSCGSVTDCSFACIDSSSCWGFIHDGTQGRRFSTSTNLQNNIVYDPQYTTYLRRKTFPEGFENSTMTTTQLNVFKPASNSFMKDFLGTSSVSQLIADMDKLDMTITNNLIYLNRKYNEESKQLQSSIETAFQNVSLNLSSRNSSQQTKKDEYAELVNKVEDEILQINRQTYEHLGWSVLVITLVLVSIKVLNGGSN